MIVKNDVRPFQQPRCFESDEFRIAWPRPDQVDLVHTESSPAPSPGSSGVNA